MDYSEDIVQLVVKRLESMPNNIKTHLGNYGSFDRDELIAAVKRKDEFGKLVIEMQLNYLRSFKKGIE